MTLHRNGSDGWATDELDSLIRMALHGSVAGAAPSPRVWERIQRDVDRLAVMGQARIRRVPGVLLQVAAACLLRVDVFLPALETPGVQRDKHAAWGDDAEWMRILDQHRQVMPLVC